MKLLRPHLLKHVNVIIVLVVALFSVSLSAQTAGTGSIQGTLVDPSGAVVPNASVTITNIATGIQSKTATGEGGLYSFPNISVGSYNLSVVAAGFQQYSQKGITLEVGSNIAINVGLSIGSTDQKIEVQANGIALQTEDASFKQTIDQKTLTELPLNGRQVTSLITLSGGAAPAPANDIQGSKTFYSSVVISVGGGMGNATDYRLDGGDHNDYVTNINLPFPFPDAISQFSVETSALGAQSGLHPGGLVNVVTRSGSNQWHGSAFEFIRNNFIDATNFFSTSKDTLHQNQYGGTVGGKVIRDKLFFFGGYQHLKADQSQALSQAYVPTAANLAGDFSVTDGASCQTNGKAVQLLNPFTGAVLANNHIDPSTFSAQALALQKYLPVTANPCGLVSYAIPSQQSEDEIIGRVDSTINQKHSLYGRYFYDDYTSPAFFSPTNVLLTTQSGNYERVQGITVGETYVINSKIVNSLHATGTRRAITRGAAPQGINPSTIGVALYDPLPNFLQLTVTNKWSTYCGTCVTATNNINTFSFADDVNLVLGKHQLAFGGEFVRSQFNALSPFEENGTFGFTGVYSQKGPAGKSTGGTGADANLDFLTGALNTFQQSKPQQDALRDSIPSLYIQDTYHVSSRIVVSAGVRWDPEFMPVDYFNRGATFSQTNFTNNIHSTVFPNAPSGTFFYGDAGVPRAFTKNSPAQFSPRFGATLDPAGNGKTVFRLGAALVYDEPNFFTGQHVYQNPPYSAAISNLPVNVPLSFASPWSGGSSPGNPFPLPYLPTANTTFPLQAQYIFFPEKFHPPYTMQWTASVQQQLGKGWDFQLDYIGSKTSFNAYGFPLNPAVYLPGNCGASPCSTTGNTSSRFKLTLASPSQGPYYLGGGAGTVLVASGANASYNGVVATIQHRVSPVFTFLANYTWSHCLDIEDAQGDIATTTIQDPSNIKGDRANCGFDYRSIFNTTLVATSNFGLEGWARRLINNWEIAPLIHTTDGAPFTVTSGVDNSLTDVLNDRPNLVNPNAVYTRQAITRTTAGNRNYINSAAFVQNAVGTFGNAGRNSFRGPAFFQMDAELTRTFPIEGRLAFNVRFEAFNVLNHPSFSNPASSLISSTFGQITSTPGSYGARVFQLAGKITF